MPRAPAPSPRKPAAARSTAKARAQALAELDAPWPLIDRYPVLLGSNLTLQYISTALRSCMSGYRQPFVDLLSELLERESHAQGMVGKRIEKIAGGRLELSPAELPPGHRDEKLAQQITDACSQHIRALPDLVQRLASLAWADIYGLSALETRWTQDDGFWPERLHFVHNRRLSYPDPQSWDLHLWDQGQVLGAGFDAPSSSALGWGLNLANLPDGKFIVHTPQFRNEYPTREGLGRPLTWLMAFKILGMRQGQQFIERWTKIIIWASYSTANEKGVSRAATTSDIRKADAALKALGVGNLTSATLADAIKIQMSGAALEGNANALTVSDWIEICDNQITKLLVGSTFTTEPGKFGSKGTSEVGKEGEMEGARYSAGMMAETLRRDLVRAMVAYNFPHAPHLVPRVALLLDKPDPGAIVELASKAAAAGIPVDADDVAQKAGLKTVRADDPKARRMAPVKAVDLTALTGGTPPPPPAPVTPAAPKGDEDGDEEPTTKTPDEGDDQENE